MNSMYFDKTQIENGLHNEFINFLIKQSYSEQDSFKYYNDIRIKPEDLGAITVEWESVSWDSEWRDGEWEWIDTEHAVMKEVIFPDNHIEFLLDNDENEAITEWLKDNPGYYKDDYGNWREKIETKKPKTLLCEDCNDN